MKNTLLLAFALLWFGNNTYAQNLVIPDTLLKKKLIALGIDTNNDKEISKDEATAVTSLNISYVLATSLKGLEGFVNLTSLNCNYCSLDTIDVSGNSKLQTLLCRSNHNNSTYLGSRAIYFPNTSELIVIDCDFNNINNIDLTHLSKLKILNCSGNNFTSLDLTKNPELEVLDISSTKMASVDLSKNSKLKFLHGEQASFTTLDLTSNPALTLLSIEFSNVTSLDLHNNILLDSLILGSNNTTFIDISKNTALQYIYWGKVYSSLTVCVWQLPFPPAGISVTGFGSITYSTDCTITATNNPTQEDLEVFPNPANGQVTLKGTAFKGILKIIDQMGTVVKEQYFEMSADQNSGLSLDQLKSGMHTILLTGNGKSISKKIVVQ